MACYRVLQTRLQSRLDALQQEMERIGNKDFSGRVPVKALPQGDEVDDLLKTSDATSQTLEREFQRLNRMDNYRKEFIGDISHELKTPIYAVHGFTETLMNGALDDPKVNYRFLQKIMKNVNRLTYLTHDLMEISRLETGEIATERHPISLLSILRDVTDSLQHKAEEEQVRLQSSFNHQDYVVLADRNRIRQALMNLVDNAIKYNNRRGTVTLATRTSNELPGKVLVEVQDTGIGIPGRSLPRVTERFYRVDKSRSRERGGTGLGLSIVKHIIEAHNERLYISSEPGQGSRFSFSLTLADSTHSSSDRTATAPHHATPDRQE